MGRRYIPPTHVFSIRGPVPVEYVPEVLDDDGITTLSGKAVLYGRRILVDQNLPEDEMEAVVAHEALHIWAHDTGFDDLFRHLEEPFVQSLSSFITMYRQFRPPRRRKTP